MSFIRIPSRHYQTWLVIFTLLGLVFVVITTWKYGAGVSSDAVRAMSTAEGLLSGRGFVDFVGSPYVLWPPLYPLILAGLSLLSGLDVFHVGWYLNLILFPINVGLWGILFKRIFPGKLHYALFASAVSLFSSSMIRIYANVASDPLFVTLMILFFFAAAAYLSGGSLHSLWSMFLLAGLAMLQRYLGVVLFGLAAGIILLRQGPPGIVKMLFPGLISIAPLAAWLVLHNYFGYGTLFGGRAYDEMWPLENISLSTTKILHWFLPYAPGIKQLLLQPWLILMPLVLLLIVLNLREEEHWKAWVQKLIGAHTGPPLLFAFVYYLLLAFTVHTIDHRDLTSDRYYIILLPILLVFILLTWESLAAPHLAKIPIGRVGLLVLTMAWFVYPIYDLQEYLRLALVNGEPSNYNIYNSRYFTEMEVVEKGRRLIEQHPEAEIYTNYVNLLWFQYKRPIRMLLPVDNGLPQNERMESLREKYSGWPGEQQGFIIWFTPNEYKYLADPEDLQYIAKLRMIYRDEQGSIYQVEAK